MCSLRFFRWLLVSLLLIFLLMLFLGLFLTFILVFFATLVAHIKPPVDKSLSLSVSEAILKNNWNRFVTPANIGYGWTMVKK